MKFLDISIENIKEISPFLYGADEFTCEASFVNLLIWKSIYNNRFYIDDDVLCISSSAGAGDFFALPFGNFEKGMSLLCEHNGGLPLIWAQQGNRFNEFCRLYGDKYEIIESRNDFDYLYSSVSLAQLSGKRYHSKRNHISAFSRNYDWHCEEINEGNIDSVVRCADLWYRQNAEFIDERLLCEKKSLNYLLENRWLLSLKGVAIFVGDSVVAFALGSPLNKKVFDVHIEKALDAYSTAYSVVNQEFAKKIAKDFLYINREDDLGIEGLRRSKLSYHPETLVKKFICKPKE